MHTFLVHSKKEQNIQQTSKTMNRCLMNIGNNIVHLGQKLYINCSKLWIMFLQ